ncbi:gamma-glutamyltransferase [Achromobacter sp. Marseille-Q4962]|uniref:gamma-glutamyltransferase n=1 Tax=Achromobacter sp. Marseille-Q4962 TaxID=2942202 RepID=UPI00207315A1|nr:gamma-glutamyltransferase [Achromobacter sp. Marseille-Q4962]
MPDPFDWSFPYPSQKMPVLASNAVATSQPLAAQAGLRMLLAGGNAVDAALAAAIALTVVEPVMNGIGGDMFALVWHGGRLHGLNSSGAAPAAWTPEYFAGRETMPPTGWGAVTVPGQVAGWKALSERFGKLPFERLFEPAISYAEQGYAVSPTIARQWATQAPRLAGEPGFARAFLPGGEAPRAGQWWKFPDQARTLREIAESGGASFYRGDLARRIADFARETGGALREADLAEHCAEWVEPISQAFRGYELHEIPPNGQGIAALMALGMLEHFDLESMGRDSADYYHVSIEAMKLAFADLHHHVADPRHMRTSAAALLDPAYLRERARLISMDRSAVPPAGAPAAGGTVYLTAADADGTMVSFIQSNYHGFGSGVVVPGTGISLHNRGMNFVLAPGHANQVAPRKKPMHTIIPAFLTRGGRPLMSFGVMGGSMQAQGHVQMATRLAAFGQNPQAMSDAPRFRVENGPVVNVESHLPADVAQALRDRGHTIAVAPRDSLEFGSAQLICRLEQGGYVAASDSRRDGQAVGY